MRRKILITGGAGFIGSNLVRRLLAHDPEIEVRNLDKLTYAGNLDNLKDVEGDPNYTFIYGDIADPFVVQKAVEGCDAVMHLAAESHVDRSIEESSPFIHTNVLGTQVLLDAARHARVGTFVHISTDEVYGSLPLDRPERKFRETDPLAPSSPYAASKASSDLLVQAAHTTFGLRTMITRCSNNYGPRQHREKLIPLFASRLLAGESVPLYGDGKNVRDWIHVDDHCDALIAVLERGTPGEVYNVGADNERSNLEITEALLRLTGRDQSHVTRVTDRLGHDRRYAIDATKIRRELGWEPRRTDWTEALAETVNGYANPCTEMH